jgi:hypothetical protein
MFETNENIRISSFDAIIVLLIIFFGLLICNNSSRNITEYNRKSVSNYMSVSDNNAVSKPCISVQIFQKTWILNKDNFNLLAFNRNQSENNKTGIKISHLQIIRQNSHKIPQFILFYHLFPDEAGEPPLLS